MTKLASPLLRRTGFTLIETLIYIALLSMIIGGSIVVTNEITESSQRESSSFAALSEADFLKHKLAWLFDGASDVLVLSEHELETTTDEGTFCVSASSGTLMLSRDACTVASAVPERLTSSEISLSDVEFSQEENAVSAAFSMNGERYSFITELR